MIEAAACPAGAVREAPRKLLVGLIGAGIQLSLSPGLHEEEARHHGLQLHYQLLDLDHMEGGAAALPAVVAACRSTGFAGFNVTYPCKQAVIPLLDELADDARRIGAVNTVVVRDGRLVGHNTDASGWMLGFERTLPGADLSQVVLIGAGGAGAAIAHAVIALGAQSLRIVDAAPERAAALAEALNAAHDGTRARAEPELARALQDATGLIHATPVGMDKLPGLAVPEALLHARLWVSEIVYSPIRTALVQAASARGCRVSDGGGMAVGQAMGAFRLFTGCDADAARMDAHFRRLLQARRC